MPNGVKKENLPTKVCVNCNRPFNWRKKWERCWDEVTTCSKSCNRQRRSQGQNTTMESKTKIDPDESAFSDSYDPDISTHDDTKDTKDNNMLCNADEALQLLQLGLATIFSEEECSNYNHDSDSEDDTKSNIPITQQQSNHTELLDEKALRKQRKKTVKAERRLKREGKADANVGQKPCTVCSKQSDLLVRCMIGSFC